MKNDSIFMVTATALLATLSGCVAASDEGENAEVGGSEEALTLSRPITAAECQAFQRERPTTPATLSTGVTVGTPFRGCDLNSGAIFGTIDLAYAEQLMAGTGYTPIAVHQAGKAPTGLARLYFVNYLTTDLGPYNEFIFLVDAASANASADAKKLTFVNPISALLPAFDPKDRTLLHQLILEKTATTPIAYGRELLGLDKRAGNVDISVTNTSFAFSVKDEKGAPVVRGTIHPDKRVTTLLQTVIRLAGAAVGEFITPGDIAMKLRPLTLNQPIEVVGRGFSRDPLNPGQIAPSKTTYRWFPTMNEASAQTLELELDGSSELGRKLLDAHFTPKAVVEAEHVSIVSERK